MSRSVAVLRIEADTAYHEREAIPASSPEARAANFERELRHRRDADLLEYLTDPPKTVDELADKVKQLPGAEHIDVEEDRASDDPSCYGVEVFVRGLDIHVSEGSEEDYVLAAWYAAVAMATKKR